MPVRRYVDLTRAELVSLLAPGPSPASAKCARALRRGAVYRVHSDTVTREGALRIYALRAQSMQFDGTQTIGVEEALKELAASAYVRLRLAAVSGIWDFTLFMDPECQTLVACLGVEGRTPY